jgi:hypothetical protein
MRLKREKEDTDWHALCRTIAEWRDDMTSYWAASKDGGESMCASVGDHWRTKRELEDWLESQKAKGWHLDYELVEIDSHPLYHMDKARAFELMDSLEYVEFDSNISEAFDETVVIHDANSAVVVRGFASTKAKALVLATACLIEHGGR